MTLVSQFIIKTQNDTRLYYNNEKHLFIIHGKAMKKETYKIYTGFESLGDIMGGVTKKLGIERGLKEITLLKIWPKLVGKRFENSSRAISIINKGKIDILFVAVKSSVVSQELYMFKFDILKKIKLSADSLGFNITDINFSTKFWETEVKAEEEKNEEYMNFYTIEPTDEEMQEIEVPQNIIDLAKKSISYQNFSDEKLKNRMLNTVINDIKTQIWRKNKGFPCCEGCGIPLTHVRETEKPLCPACKYN